MIKFGRVRFRVKKLCVTIGSKQTGSNTKKEASGGENQGPMLIDQQVSMRELSEMSARQETMLS